MEEALVLTKFANEVTIVHRRDQFRASAIMQRRVKENPKIKTIFNSEIVEILGENKVEKVKIKTKAIRDSQIAVRENNQKLYKTPEEFGGEMRQATGDTLEWEMPIDGVFVAVGHIPNSALFQGIDRAQEGFIKVYNHTKTNVEGVYVAGDVHDAEYKQAVTAAGFGCMAALEVEKYLMEQPR